MTKPKYKNRKYTIEPYNPNWKKQFEDEAENLRFIFSDKAISIEHIGSTSVPGLAGKPTVDILITVKNIEIADELSEKIESKGYKALGDHINQGSRLFVKEEGNTRLMNLHVFEAEHPHVKEMINLRKYFRSHPEKVEEYSKLKFDLIEKYPDNYELYRKYKDKWMENLLELIEKVDEGLAEKAMAKIEDKIQEWQKEKKKLVVGIDGYMGIGKTTVLKRLAECNPDILPVHRDDFIIGKTEFAERMNSGRDRSAVMEYEICDDKKLLSLMRAFKNQQGPYSIHLYKSQSDETEEKTYDFSKPIMVVEGIFLLHPKLYGNAIDFKILIDGDLDAADERRIAREKARWGKDYFPHDHPDNYFRIVGVAFRRYYEKYDPGEIADLVINVD